MKPESLVSYKKYLRIELINNHKYQYLTIIDRMKMITFKRPKERFNQGVSYKIFIGNEMLTELKNGEEKTIEIAPEFENKSIKAKIQKWWGSENIKISSLSKNETLNVKGNKFLNLKATFIVSLLPLTGLFMFGYGKGTPIIKNIGIGIFILFLLFAFGILITGRNKWLNINRTN